MKQHRVKRTETVKLSDLKVNLFVRQELDQDHVIYLAELYEAGVRFKDNILVTDDYTIIDGRHRKDAYDLNNVKEVAVDIVAVVDETQLIALAYRSNSGGSKPPSIADTEHTIKLLIERKETIKNIAELLALPPTLTRKYVTSVKSRMNRVALQSAATAIAEEGLRIGEAAEKYGVSEEKLKDLLSMHRKKGKKDAQETRRNLTKAYKSLSLKVVSHLRRLRQELEDGDVSVQQVRETFKQIHRLQKTSARSLREWERRMLAEEGVRLAKSA